MTVERMVTWLIDGNNLKCCRGVPNDRMAIAKELESIASPRTLNWIMPLPKEETTLAAKREVSKKEEIVINSTELLQIILRTANAILSSIGTWRSSL